MPSLKFFHPEFHSLVSPHRLLSSAGSKPYEVAKARIQLLFLGSQYPSGNRTKHWSYDNPAGLCTFPSCLDQCLVESNEHILIHCPAYKTARENMFTLSIKVNCPVSRSLILGILLSASEQLMMQFLLDCSSIPEVIHAATNYSEAVYNNIFYISRTWCFTIHKERMKRLCKWNFR